MRFYVKRFAELTTLELYEILRVRAEIFVVEQNCVYQDLDGVDYNSLHMYVEEDGIQAYLRAFSREDEPGTVRIGRVLTREHGKGFGGLLLKQALETIRDRMQPERMYLEAQCYATGFYEREGFRICTEEFLEDGIPHVGMELIERVKGASDIDTDAGNSCDAGGGEVDP